MKKILVTGGTGFIGTNLIQKLIKKGYMIHVLSRKKKYIKSAKVFWWNPSNQMCIRDRDKGIIIMDYGVRRFTFQKQMLIGFDLIWK